MHAIPVRRNLPLGQRNFKEWSRLRAVVFHIRDSIIITIVMRGTDSAQDSVYDAFESSAGSSDVNDHHRLTVKRVEDFSVNVRGQCQYEVYSAPIIALYLV